ncbi:thiamine diphosphokinase [Clostridium taeniosporum]|uniref:Thiamine diphosphokinase n=1 Tax=Clostridium taeniosporum TaxID=394958 RepID=A0A1D7XIT5_9CLOT|nr:thiamine diphosphokinase [Clostridium taeniosporum]AOR23235.1 thiamine diphosphokinase [Clostridium taeniosporum]
MKVMIVSGGTPPSETLLVQYKEKVDFIVAADKGGEYLLKYNVIPDLLIGDFDSMSKEILEKLKKVTKEILEFPPEKDYTDTEIAIMESIKRGGKKIYLLGATGTRIDHTLGNIGLLLSYKKKGISLEIIDNNNRMYLAKNRIVLNGKQGENVSFHALSNTVKNFKIAGAKYNIPQGKDISLLDPAAICNEFLETPISIEYDEGEVLILHSFD